jgi:hypothetical protein
VSIFCAARVSHIDVVVGIVARKVHVMVWFALMEEARHTGVSISNVEPARVANIPDCMFLSHVGVTWCLHHCYRWGSTRLWRAELASDQRKIYLYASWRRRDAWQKTLFSDNAGWEIHHGDISKRGGTPSSSAEVSISAASCSSSISAIGHGIMA